MILNDFVGIGPHMQWGCITSLPANFSENNKGTTTSLICFKQIFSDPAPKNPKTLNLSSKLFITEPVCTNITFTSIVFPLLHSVCPTLGDLHLVFDRVVYELRNVTVSNSLSDLICQHVVGIHIFVCCLCGRRYKSLSHSVHKTRIFLIIIPPKMYDELVSRSYETEV